MQEKNALCEQFSARFTEALGSSGIRQKDLAEHTNIREQTLSRYKTGERIPDTYELYRIAVALGVNVIPALFFYRNGRIEKNFTGYMKKDELKTKLGL